MNGWRNAGIAFVLLAMLAWSVYIAFWQLTLGVPPIEGAAEQEARLRLTILAIWLTGLGIGVVALVGLSRRTFDSVPLARRRKLAIGGYVIGALIVIGLAMFELLGLLVFGWILTGSCARPSGCPSRPLSSGLPKWPGTTSCLCTAIWRG